MIQTPDWVRHAVFYQIFPDRFASSSRVDKPNFLEPWDSEPTVHGYKGGDLVGVSERLDYLQDLGITAIYFTPIFQSASNHRYHTHDYFKVDPILGGNEAFRIMLDEAHRRNIKVILDGVFNHSSRGFYQFNHTLEGGAASPYRDWFFFKDYPANAYDLRRPPGYEAWWGLHALPKFNTGNPAVRKYLMDVAEYWLKEGADGWRLDVPGEINDDSFWQEFRQRVKSVNPEAYIVGEIWDDARRWLQGDQFDAVMNYLFGERVISFTAGNRMDRRLLSGQGWHPYPMGAEEFAGGIDWLLKLYPPEVTTVQLNLLDSHDTPRFLSVAKSDTSALELATLFQMSYPGAPSIYYGDEIGIDGGKDPECRRSFIWDEARWNTGLRDYFKKAIALRREHPALRTGSYQSIYANGGVYAFIRTLEGDSVLVAMNTDRATRKFSLPVSEGEGTVPWTVLFGTGKAVQHGSTLDIQLPSRCGIAIKRPTDSR